MTDIYNYSVPSDVNTADMRLQDPTVPASPSVYYAVLKRWTGSTWEKAKLMVYSGGSFIAATLRVWVAGEWKLVDTTGA